jgi:predicted O-linked N-acetylglucosamine transferase (SPINDLY family)
MSTQDPLSNPNRPGPGTASLALGETLQRAFAFHQAGNPADATRLCKAILGAHPSHFDALHLLGVIEAQQGRLHEAHDLLSRAIRVNAQSAEAYSNHANVLKGLRRLEEALASYDRALAINPGLASALNNRGATLHDLTRREEALASYDRALAIRPAFAEALNNRGFALKDLGRYEDALASYDQALKIRPAYVEALNNRGFVLRELKRHEEALASYDRALEIRPDQAEALNDRGMTLHELGRHEEALASYERALAIRPDFAGALNNRGNVLLDLQRYEEALASYDRALAIRPAYVEALNNRGVALQGLKRHEEARASYDRALAIRPDYVGALNNRGAALNALRRYDEALASYDRALAIRPDHVGALNNRGAVLASLRRSQEALACCDRALAIKPDFAEALINRGMVLQDLQRHAEALASFDRALAIKPRYVDALNRRGAALSFLGRHEEAIADLALALEIRADLEFASGMLLHSRMHCCDWRGHEEQAAQLTSDVRAGKRCAAPFVFLAITDSAEDQLRCSRTWVHDKCPPSKTPLWQGERYRHERIRLAYLSADLHEHPLGFLTAGLFEGHDQKRFETIAVSFGPDTQGAMRSRLKAAFERFIDVWPQSDREVAELLRKLEVDIVVDLMGFTLGARTGILALRPAPVQVNYLGYPGAMGADYIDYILADRFVIPEEQKTRYAEKVVYLPDTFQANDSKRRIAPGTPCRAEVGLPSQGFVFCSFNASYKITPALFDVWMRLLRRADRSVLWLVQGSASIEANLRREAAVRGVDPDRVVFAPKLPYADHLARYRLADLFLDTLPFNAGATASDALWAGLPVLTCPGQALAARYAGSLLHAIGLPELIARSLEEYEAMALRLATDTALLVGLKQKLSRNRDSHPLFDTDRFRRNIEAAYVAMWERYQRGEAPASFAVAPVAAAGAP